MAVVHTNFIGSCFDKFPGEKSLRAGVYSERKTQGNYAEMRRTRGFLGESGGRQDF